MKDRTKRKLKSFLKMWTFGTLVIALHAAGITIALRVMEYFDPLSIGMIALYFIITGVVALILDS